MRVNDRSFRQLATCQVNTMMRKLWVHRHPQMTNNHTYALCGYGAWADWFQP